MGGLVTSKPSTGRVEEVPAHVGDHAGDVGQLAQGVHHGQVRQADVAKLDAAAAEHPHPPPAGPVGQGQQQPGLAHPGVARQ